MKFSSLKTSLCLFLLAPAFCQAQSSVYRFDHLTDGFLIGQDNWIEGNTNGFGNDCLAVFTRSAGSGNKGVRSVAAIGQSAYRFNNQTFAFPPFSNTETNATAYGDFLVRVREGSWNSLVGVASDSNDAGTGIDTPVEFSPSFGVHRIPGSDSAFVIRGAREGTLYRQSVTGYAVEGDWVRLKFVMNLQSGVGNLFVRNLSSGATTYTLLPACTNVDLQLSRMAPECPPSTWNALVFRIVSDMPGAATDATAVDNLIPHASALGTTITSSTPPRWASVSAEGLVAGESYSVESAPIGASGPWVSELSFTATAAEMTVNVRVTPDTYSARQFRVVLAP